MSPAEVLLPRKSLLGSSGGVERFSAASRAAAGAAEPRRLGLQLDPRWVPLRAVAEEAIEDQRAIRPDPARELAVAIPPELRVLADREVLLMLVHNLVGNALQHAPEGGVTVAWSADATLTVDDEGPGFPDAGEEVRPRGYGLGLALARRLCETQGWTLRTARSPAGGARVSIQFPDAAVRSAAVA